MGNSHTDDFSSGAGVVWRAVVDEAGNVSIDEPLPLMPLPGDLYGWAADLNALIDASFQVTGYSHRGESLYEAVVWTVGVNPGGALATPDPPVSLGTPLEWSQASAINTPGDVCGTSDGMPFVAPAGQTAQPLPVPRNTHSGSAYDINDLGETVGTLRIFIRGGAYRTTDAYLWKDDDVIDLETQIDRKSGWATLWNAKAINNAGVIAGRGYFDVESRGFLLIPNEP